MRTALIATLGAAVLVSAAEAQTQRSEPTVYALTNARIVVAPGRTIERGTVVIRDGRIAAVGANVSAPSDVYRIDLAGRTVYAGLIDVASELGLPCPPAQGGGGPAAGAPTQFTQAQQRQVASGGQGVIPETEIWGVADQIGSIEVGKAGDLFVASGDPLDVRTTVSEVFIGGKRIPWDDRHTRLYEKYNARPSVKASGH